MECTCFQESRGNNSKIMNAHKWCLRFSSRASFYWYMCFYLPIISFTVISYAKLIFSQLFMLYYILIYGLICIRLFILLVQFDWKYGSMYHYFYIYLAFQMYKVRKMKNAIRWLWKKGFCWTKSDIEILFIASFFRRLELLIFLFLQTLCWYPEVIELYI